MPEFLKLVFQVKAEIMLSGFFLTFVVAFTNHNQVFVLLSV